MLPSIRAVPVRVGRLAVNARYTTAGNSRVHIRVVLGL